MGIQTMDADLARCRMAKLSVMGNDESNMEDCSSVVTSAFASS